MNAITLGQALEEHQAAMIGVLSDQTVKWYATKLKSLKDYLGANHRLDSITLSDLRKWRALLEKRTTRYDSHPTKPVQQGGLAPETFRSIVRGVRLFFRWCVAEGLLVTNPAERLELPKREKNPRKGIAESDMHHIIDAAKSDTRDYALCLFMADTACRAGGITTLKISDLDLANRRAIVTEKGLGGHGLPRAVFFEQDTTEALRAWLQERETWPHHETEYVFIGTRGPLTYSGVYLLIKRIAKSLGLAGGWNPHNWRHGAARAMLKNGASLAHVQQILGHADVSTTARFYATFATRELQEAHDRYSWRAGSGLQPEVQHG